VEKLRPNINLLFLLFFTSGHLPAGVRDALRQAKSEDEIKELIGTL
jgi:hypothetical protein